MRDEWLKELKKNSTVFPDGWYTPPPHGIIVVFGSESDTKRISALSFRPSSYWASKKNYLNRSKGIAVLHCSLVHKKTGIIGDLGMTLYFGKNKKIQEHIKTCLKINYAIFDYLYEGIKLSEISEYAHKLLKANKLRSNLSSPSDPTGTNIGHTIPFIYEKMKVLEEKILHSANKDWLSFVNLISKKRIFINSIESCKFKKYSALTIEPRPHKPYHPELPRIYFHTIACMNKNGKKDLLTNFDEVFKIAGMDYMLSTNL